jgi:hypothetical protein
MPLSEAVPLSEPVQQIDDPLEFEQEISASFHEDIDTETKKDIILYIQKQELKQVHTKLPDNITFKKKRYNINRFTAKRR